jgi:hypothetical protein
MCPAAVSFGGRISPVMDARRTRRPMNSLQKLIADYLADNHGENYSTIARRGGLPRSTVYSLATKEERRQTPHPETIRKLAKGMSMVESVVKAAAGDAAGYRSVSSELGTERARLIVEAASHLDDERLEALARRARHLLAEMREEEAAGGGD